MIRFVIVFATVLFSFSASAFNPQELWQAWPEARFENTVAPCLRHAGLMQSLHKLESRHTNQIRLEEIGKSFLGRPIQMLTLGQGNKKILLWSQMHGDEPSATPALLDIANYLLEHASEPEVRTILDSFTLMIIPMLNPDGSEVYQRFNAQGIDINRDALHLATPEGRILKRIRDEHEPMLGFNLHDQNRRTAVGNSGIVATNAVLAVSGDEANTLTPGRERSKRASSAIVEALAAFMPGGMARYDEDWSPRAFGDNITAWGTPVVLIESGGLPPGREFSELTRLNFVAILAVLQGLARDDLAGYSPQVYEDLLRNQSGSWSDVVVSGGYIQQPGTSTAFRADLAFDVLRNDRQAAGCSDNGRVSSRIFTLGDASFQGAGKLVDAKDSLLLAAFDVGVRDWSARQWLNYENLLRLARLGVGTIYWAVNETHRGEAMEYTKKAGVQGVPRIEVRTKPAVFPQVVLTEAPPVPVTLTLPGILQSLGVEDPNRSDALAKMWIEPPADRVGSARLRKSQPANFLILSPVEEGQINNSKTKLRSVWLEGQQVPAE